MDEKYERHLRRRAIRQLLHGNHPTQIAHSVNRSRQWVNKWWQRFRDRSWAGLKSQSRCPQHPHRRYGSPLRRLIGCARRTLTHAAVGLIGPNAVREKLREWRIRPLPSRATIARELQAQGLTQTTSVPVKTTYYPHPHPSAHYTLHAMDWTSQQLRRGVTVFAFNTTDYSTHDLCSRVSRDKSAETVCGYATQVWQRLGLPDGLQVDNDAAFSGGRRGPRVFSRFVRLCLYVGIEPIFIPFYEAERNEQIENINGLWQRAFWRRRRFRSLPDVQRRNPQFEHWFGTNTNHRH